ncbi:group II intron reverse transcriptase/maturase, partial [Mesorhizobium sp. M0118]
MFDFLGYQFRPPRVANTQRDEFFCGYTPAAVDERPFRYIREDFFLGRSFRNLEDLNAQLRHWLDT